MSSQRRILVAALLLLVAGALACVGGPQKPSVEIVSPPSGSQVPLGEEVEVQYRATDSVAVVRVDLEVAGQVIDSQNSPVADGQPTMTGVLRWRAEEAGSHTLIVYAYGRDRVASNPVGVTITVGEGEAVPDSTVTISLLLPGHTSTPDSTVTVPATAATASATGSQSASTPSPTGPAATSTSPPPTPTQRQAAPAPPTATQPPPPPPTATNPPPSPTPTTELANLWVENQTSVDICEVYFSLPSEPWGPNRLLGGNRIYAGQSALWTIPPGNYDLWALDCAGNGLVVISNQPIYGNWTWEILPPAPPAPPAQPLSLTVYNYCSEAIGELYIYRPSDPNNGPNQIPGYSIPPGGSQTFGIESGIWAIDAYKVDGYWLDSMPPTEFPPGSDGMWNACAVG
jgi:hypothetical protein